jgi:histidine triad (HIT) family protein
VSENCIFCKIARNEAPASIVYEDTDVMAFVDIRPVSEGHTLIIPKKHYVDIYDTPDQLLAALHVIVKKIAVAIKRVTNADGISIVQQNGKAAGQDIFHIHVHVIPRFEGKKIPRFGELMVVSRETLEKVAQKIRQQLTDSI